MILEAGKSTWNIDPLPQFCNEFESRRGGSGCWQRPMNKGALSRRQSETGCEPLG